jgi:cell division protein ZapE
MNLSPLQRYQHDLEHAGFTQDQAQRHAIQQLENLYHRLIKAHGRKGRLSAQTLLRALSIKSTSTPEKGLYFWGGVGRGKTYLMDIFFESLPFPEKMRVHFHRFMRLVHEELKSLQQQKNPLEIVAKRLADKTRVICFDEFFVSDITDAMILAGLVDGLFKRGVTLVATSNIVPDGLYKDGLQRARFLPAIALLKQHTDVINVDGGIDYRLRTLEHAELYPWPLDDEADSCLKTSFDSLVPDINEVVENITLDIEGRPITARYHAEDVAWFDFAALCDGPRSQNDYIALSKEYHAVLISNIPELDERKEDQARRFINLVDEFYDRKVKLIITAEKPIHQLYSGNRLVFEFDRTQRRLLETQSHDY